MDASSTMTPEQFATAVQQQAALQLYQQLAATLSEKCYRACVPKPGSRLETSEKTCLRKCAENYLEVVAIVRDAYEASDV